VYNDVVKFIEACDQEKTVGNSNLYLKLINEEYEELLDSKYREEELDACLDLIWVILGYCYMRGYDVEGGWNEVARSNLDKIDKVTGKVKKREDGKVLKPNDWQPPKLETFV
jgi:predicted HAD superfamily Cof-like phosphohydrolase